MNRFQDKVVLVTGGSSGIGLAAARQFVAEGAHVYITGRRQRELDEAAAAIGHAVTAVRADASSAADLERLYQTVRANHGRIDVVFANAGRVVMGALGEISEAQYAEQFDLNVKGVLFTVQMALPLMSKGGAIVLNASIATLKAYPGSSLYGASKAAVRAFARGWALDLKDRGIRVNAISPGPTETAVLEASGMNAEQVEQTKAHLASTIPLGRMGHADEVARATLFLASDDASFMTGSELFVDGGIAQV